MSVLEQLPLEISTEIFSYLPRADLLKLSSLSHYIHAVSQPLLFKTLTLTSADGETKSPLQGLLEVILSPGGQTLATHVRSLQVKWGSRYKSPSDISLLTEAASRHGLHLPLRWEEGQLVLLLHLLPCLHDLDLSPSGEGDDKFLRFLASQTRGTALAPGLRHLRRFRCAPENSHTGIHPSMLLTLLTLPCMRQIDVRLVNEDTLALPDFEAAASQSRVTHLRLVDAELPADSLARILGVPAGLTHLTYCVHSRVFDVVAFSAALQALQHTLQVLHIDVFELRHPSSAPADAHIGSLISWRSLRDVRGPLTAFLGKPQTTATPSLADVLPAGIREFEILTDQYWSVAQEGHEMMELVMQKPARVPRLRVLTADLGGRAVLRSRGSLKRACELAMVELCDNSTYRDVLRRKVGCSRPRTKQSCSGRRIR